MRIIAILLLLSACNVGQEQAQEPESKFDDPIVIKIAQWQDQRETDSLVIALEQMAPEYQEVAAWALASVQDNQAIDALAIALKSENSEVKKAALFALGQTFDSLGYVALIEINEKDLTSKERFYWLEAIGKTIPKAELSFLQNVDLLRKDTLSTAGLVWGLYHAGRRGAYNNRTVQMAVNILDTTTSYMAQLGAAHYLARIQFEALPNAALRIMAKNYDTPEVRMALALALRKSDQTGALRLKKKFLEDPDYRVRVNAVRSISDISHLKSHLDTLLNDENINTSIVTADKIAEFANDLDSATFYSFLAKELPWRVNATLLEGYLLKNPSEEKVIEQVKAEFKASQSPYEKAAYLSALKASVTANEFLITETFKAEHPAISTSGMSALVYMRRMDGFPTALKPAFQDVVIEAVQSEDPAMIDIAAVLLRDTTLNFKDTLTDLEFLRKAKEQLELPKENETMQSLERTLAYFEDREPEPVVNEYNNPIDWEDINLYHDRDTAIIKTEKGDIVLELYLNKAPGSVLNFINLSKSGFYDGKVFHRVVPNFVIQGGGSRGDGWGSEGYSIRSEFGDLRYKTGSVGMASAGKDTEGTQWFITHSPTPHLDGGYTIFAQVIEGMEVVHSIEVGDAIQSVIIN